MLFRGPNPAGVTLTVTPRKPRIRNPESSVSTVQKPMLRLGGQHLKRGGNKLVDLYESSILVSRRSITCRKAAPATRGP